MALPSGAAVTSGAGPEGELETCSKLSTMLGVAEPGLVTTSTRSLKMNLGVSEAAEAAGGACVSSGVDEAGAANIKNEGAVVGPGEDAVVVVVDATGVILGDDSPDEVRAEDADDGETEMIAEGAGRSADAESDLRETEAADDAVCSLSGDDWGDAPAARRASMSPWVGTHSSESESRGPASGSAGGSCTGDGGPLGVDAGRPVGEGVRREPTECSSFTCPAGRLD